MLDNVAILSSSQKCWALTNRSNDVAQNVVLGTLLSKSLGETDHGQLSSRVVGLTKVAEQTRGRGSVDDTAILLFFEVRPGGTGNLVSTLDVDLHDEVPVLVGHVLEANISENTSIVDDNINAAKGLDGRLDDLVAILDTVVVGSSLAASLLNLVDNNVGSL